MRYPKSGSNTFLRVGFISIFLLFSTMLQAQSVSAGFVWWDGYFFSQHHEDGEKGGQSGFYLADDNGNTIEVQTIELSYVEENGDKTPVPMKEPKWFTSVSPDYPQFYGSYSCESSPEDISILIYSILIIYAIRFNILMRGTAGHGD